MNIYPRKSFVREADILLLKSIIKSKLLDAKYWTASRADRPD